MEKIRRETKLTKSRAQSTRQKPVLYTGVQKNCQQGPKPCCESPPVSEHLSFSQEESCCKISTTVHSIFSNILSSAEQIATSVASQRIHESGTCKYIYFVNLYCIKGLVMIDLNILRFCLHFSFSFFSPEQKSQSRIYVSSG